MLMTSLVKLQQVQWLGAVDAARAYGASLITFVGRELDSPLGFDAHGNVIYDAVGAEAVDGLILWSTALQVFVGAEPLRAFTHRWESVPLVSVEQVLAGHPSVQFDNRGGMRAVVSHLIEGHGRRRIAFVRGPADHIGARDRYLGYLDALAERGLVADPELVSPFSSSWVSDEPVAWLKRLLDQGVEVDAVVTVNDIVAFSILAALEECGVRVPEEMAVTGYDDVAGGLYPIGASSALRVHAAADSVSPGTGAARPWYEPVYGDPGLDHEELATVGAAPEPAVNLSASTLPLTTVRVPFYELGWRAVEILLARLDGQQVPDVEVRPTQLVVRRSCGCSQPPPDTGTDAEVLDRLTAAFVGELAGEPGQPFVRLLDESLRASMRSGQPLARWWEVLRDLRQRTGAAGAGDGSSSEALWANAQRLMEETAERMTLYQGLLVEKRNQLVREVGQRLVTTLDPAELAAVLAEQLSSLAIPGCYLATYAPSGTPGAGAYERSRALLVYEYGRVVGVAAEDALFPTRRLAPRGLLARADARCLVALPLHFKEQQLGFVLFELGPRVGWIYEALQQQLSSALEAAVLVQREREVQRELQLEMAQRADAEAALQRAHDELERRVAVRTVELAHANDVLTQQILERQQAEAAQAKLEDELRQAQKMEAIGRLAGGIAHDFNNMLVVIIGVSDLLLERGRHDGEARLELEQIRQAGERAAELTKRLLTFSRHQLTQLTVLNLNTVVNDVEPMLRRLIGEHIELVTALTPTVTPVKADASQVEQIILNLAVNARDAMPDGGRLTIKTANRTLDEAYARGHVGVVPGRYVMLRVSDTGIGMDASTKERAFEPFFTTKPTGYGTGLGLATVFGIVQQSHGHIAITSRPHHGTTFTIYLPSSTGQPTTPTLPPTSPASVRGTETILLVEDEPAVRRAVRRFLEEHGYQILEAADANEALSLWQRHRHAVALTVTDLVMPGLSGHELARRIRDMNPTARILYLSGYVEEPLPTDQPEEMAIPLLAKPFSADTLASKVREVLDTPQGGGAPG
jgi:signal transduction histidine kinase/DNA-binding LacI/PurR family transcriptional regulator/CheY-like chemotaxis protein